MGRVRTALTSSVLLLTAGVTIAAAVKSAVTAWPTTERQYRAQLTRQLTDDAFAQMSQSDQLDLARRVERDFRQGLEWQTQVHALSVDQQETFRQNLARLMHLSLMDKVDRYFALPRQRRPAFLDEQMDELMDMRLLSPDPQEAGGVGDSLAEWVAVAGHLRESLMQCDVQQRRRLMRFILEAKNHAEGRGVADFRLTPEMVPR